MFQYVFLLYEKSIPKYSKTSFKTAKGFKIYFSFSLQVVDFIPSTNLFWTKALKGCFQLPVHVKIHEQLLYQFPDHL